MTRFAGLAASAAVLLVACGQGGESKITGMIDSCAVLKEIDAPGLIGAAFDPPESLRDQDGGENMGKMSACGLTSTAPEADPADLAGLAGQMRNTWFLTLMAWTWPDAESAKAYMDSMRQSSLEGIDPVEVAEVGDEAVWSGTVHARTGNVTISMDVRGPADEQGERSEKALETELAKRSLKAIRK